MIGRGRQYQCKVCGKYTDKDWQPEGESNSIEESQNFINIVCASKRILSEQEIIKQFKVDTEKWEVESIQFKTTEGYRKDKSVDWHVHNGKTDGDVSDSGKMLVVPLYHIRARFKRKTQEIRNKAALSDLIEDAKKYAPRSQKRAYPRHENGLLYEVDIPDIHFGRLVWGEESGGKDYDIKIADKDVREALNQLLSYSKNFQISKILLPLGNDFFNVNNKLEVTVHGTPQQEDTRWQKTFRLGRILLADVIEECSELAPVDVVIIPGNHDEERMFYLGDALDCWFHGNPNVHVDNKANKRKYYQFHSNLIGFTHGYYEPFDKLPAIMALEAPELWAKTTYREWHLGDRHHKRDMIQKTDESEGIVIRILRSLAPTDTWTFDKGFIGSLRAAEAFLWHPHRGLLAQFTATP